MNAFMNEADIVEYVNRGPAVGADQRCIDVKRATFRWAPGNKAICKLPRYRWHLGCILAIWVAFFSRCQRYRC